MAEVISSTGNSSVVDAARLHRARHRKEVGRTLIEGPSLVSEALAAGVELLEIFSLEGDPLPDAGRATLRIVTEPVLERVAGTTSPRGPVAVMEIPPSRLPGERPALVAWGVGDPGNVGTMIRAAAAFGYGFIAGPESADPWSPKVLRSAAGGHFRTTVGMVSVLSELEHLRLVGTVPRGGGTPGPIGVGEGLIVGSEAHGLPDAVRVACDRLVTIPMVAGTESLNAAVAAGITAYLGTLREEH